MRLLICFLLTLSLSSCYRFPEMDEYSIVPMTNNPDVTKERASNNSMPNVGF